MSRRFDKVHGQITGGSVVNVLTCPASHKYEVTLVAFGPGNGLTNWLQVLFGDTLGGTRYIDTYRLPTNENGKSFNYNALVLLAGEKLFLRSTPGSGTALQNYYVAFVDVTLE